jgi:hypothetical protein
VAAAPFGSVVALIGLPRPALAVEPRIGLYATIGAQTLSIGTAGKEVPA